MVNLNSLNATRMHRQALLFHQPICYVVQKRVSRILLIEIRINFTQERSAGVQHANLNDLRFARKIGEFRALHCFREVNEPDIYRDTDTIGS